MLSPAKKRKTTLRVTLPFKCENLENQNRVARLDGDGDIDRAFFDSTRELHMTTRSAPQLSAPAQRIVLIVYLRDYGMGTMIHSIMRLTRNWPSLNRHGSLLETYRCGSTSGFEWRQGQWPMERNSLRKKTMPVRLHL